MYHVEFDQPANLLKISYGGRVEPAETKRCLEALERLRPELRPGFRLLTDLSALETMDLASIPHIKRIMDFCNQQGIAQVVRVIPDPHKDIGLNIMSLFHYGRQVRFVTCVSLDEALAVLAGGGG